MNRSTAKYLRELRELNERRRAVRRRLLAQGELAVGTVSWVERRCGRPGCHCAREGGHRQLQFLFSDPRGGRRCKVVRRADEGRLLQAKERYRGFRAGVRELAAIQKRERVLLMALMRVRGLQYE